MGKNDAGLRSTSKRRTSNSSNITNKKNIFLNKAKQEISRPEKIDYTGGKYEPSPNGAIPTDSPLYGKIK